MTLLKGKELDNHVNKLCDEIKLWKKNNKKRKKRKIDGEDKNRVQSR
jgi:hypothetical protein